MKAGKKKHGSHGHDAHADSEAGSDRELSAVPVDESEPADAKADRSVVEGPEASAGEGEVDDTKAMEATRRALEERLLRLQADFDNFRKRTAREKGEVVLRANEDILLEMIPVLDHMDLALAATAGHQPLEAVIEGFRLAAEQLRTALGKFGLTRLDADGKAFDPNLHEAVSHLPSNTVRENTVMVQTRCGYLLGDRLLRAAQVVVSSGSPAASEVVDSLPSGTASVDNLPEPD